MGAVFRQELPDGVTHRPRGVFLDVVLRIETHHAGLFEISQEGVHKGGRESQILDPPGEKKGKMSEVPSHIDFDLGQSVG